MADTTVTGKIGDQEVELINAASEATLLKLLEAMNKMAGIQTGSKPIGRPGVGGTGSTAQQAQTTAANNMTVAMQRAGQAVGKFAGAVTDAAKSVLGFAGNIIGGFASAVINLAKELFTGGTRVSDFSKHLASLPSVFGMLGGIVHSVVGFLENLVDNYRSLTQVGANFGYSLVGMVRSAAQAGMSLGDFSKFIIANSEKLAMMSSSVTSGAKRFGELSKGLRESDVGKQLMSMGFTVEELNDTLLTYSFVNERLRRDSVRSNKEVVDGAGNFALALDRAAAATGINRRALGTSVENLTKDAAIMAAAMRLPPERRAQFSADLAALTSMFPDLEKVILQGAKGVYNSPEMAAINSQMPEFIGIMNRLRSGQIGLIEAQNELIDASRRSRTRMDQMGSEAIGQLSALSPQFEQIFNALTRAAAMAKKSQEDLDAAQAAAARKATQDANITRFFTTFEDLIVRFRARFSEMIVTSKALNSALDRVNQIFSVSDETLEPLLDKIAKTFENLLIEINDFIVVVGSDGWGAAFKQAFTRLLSSIFVSEQDIKEMTENNEANDEQLRGILQEKLKNFMLDMFKSLGGIMMDGIKALWADPEIKGAIITGALVLLGAMLAGPIIGGLISSLGGMLGGGGTGGKGGAAGGATAAGGGGGALASLGGQLAQAAGWLAKGAAVGASMVAIGYGLSQLADGMIKFEEIDWESMGKAGVTLTALVGAVSLLGNLLTGPQVAKFALGTAAIAGVGIALRQFPAETLRELSNMMETVFNGIANNIERVFNGISGIIDRITAMRTAVIDATTKQIKELAGIPADNMMAAAKGIDAIKKALDGFAPGLFSGISQSIGNLFAPDKVGPLDKMASLGPKLEEAAAGFNAFKSAMAGFSLANLDISNNQVTNFVKMSDRFPDFNKGIAALASQANGLESSARAMEAFNLAAQGFDINKFTFTREQISNLADGTVKLRALAEQLRASKDGFQKLDTQGLKNIKEGVEGLSKAFQEFNESFIGKFIPKFEELRSKTQEGLLTNLGSKLDALNSSVSSLVTVEQRSEGHLDKLASGRKPTLK